MTSYPRPRGMAKTMACLIVRCLETMPSKAFRLFPTVVSAITTPQLAPYEAVLSSVKM